MEKKKLKEEIKKTLKSYALSKDLLAKSLNLNIEDIEDALDSLVLSGEIKYLENLELYKLASKKKSKEYASIDEDLLLSLIKDEHIYHFNVLAKRLKANPKELKACLNALVKENKIYYSAFYDIYTILKVATLDVKDKGYAFAKVDGEDIEYYIPKEDIGTAYDGDICHIFPTGYDDKLKGASVYDVIERAHKIVIGKLTLKGKKYPKYKVISTMNSFKVEVDIKEEDLNGAKPGEIVSCDIEYTKGYSIKGKITEILGHPDDPGIEIAEIALEYGFKMPFSEETVEELKEIPDAVKIEEIYGRRDFRNLNVITIDGDDSKDFDDAIYLEKNSNGNYNLQVHIADVSYYVKEASPLDKDALSRGTSVYLADRVIPMIPHKLSNGICSLNEGVDRLVLSCLMEIDPKGKLINYEIVEGVIKSHHRMTYNKVNQMILGNEDVIKEYIDIYPMILDMLELSHILRAIRHKKGGIEFESEEYKFDLNPDGSPKEIHKRCQDDAEKLIEDFMLEANQTIAYHMSIMNLPCEYRIHEKPDQEKLHNTFNQIASMKIPVKNIQNDIHPKEIQSLLESVKDHPNHLIINTMLLRSMMKAKYSSECLGHYGLAMNYYCHFTSPIRRYPDLMVHRMIKKLFLHPDNLDHDIRKYQAIIPDIAFRNSKSERNAVDCERAVDDMLYAWYMESHLYEEYNATITSITSFGMFAEIDFGIEGLIAFRDMEGYYEYNEHTMSASNGINTYHLGDKVRVKVSFASKEERRIDFTLVDLEG